MNYTISVKDENGYSIPLKTFKSTKVEAMQAGWALSQRATLCDVVVTCGSKHVVTYSGGVATQYKGKDQKP